MEQGVTRVRVPAEIRGLAREIEGRVGRVVVDQGLAGAFHRLAAGITEGLVPATLLSIGGGGEEGDSQQSQAEQEMSRELHGELPLGVWGGELTGCWLAAVVPTLWWPFRRTCWRCAFVRT